MTSIVRKIIFYCGLLFWVTWGFCFADTGNTTSSAGAERLSAEPPGVSVTSGSSESSGNIINLEKKKTQLKSLKKSTGAAGNTKEIKAKEGAGEVDTAKVGKTPSLYFSRLDYEFEEVVEGTEVIHDFKVLNKGSETVHVTKVRTGCGCTTVSYSREIPPGEEGMIKIKVNTSGYGGRQLGKTISIMTDDKARPIYKLNIAGKVAKFVTISPRVVRFNGNVDKEHKAVVKIIPEEKYPFSIVSVSATRGENIKYSLEDKRKSAEKCYLLNIENHKKDAGAYYDVLVLKTDSTVQSELKINVMARLNDPKALPKSKKPVSKQGNPPAVKDTTGTPNGNPQKGGFVELIQQMQKQKVGAEKAEAAPEKQDPARAEELKKKFEALIEKAREQKENNAPAQQ